MKLSQCKKQHLKTRLYFPLKMDDCVLRYMNLKVFIGFLLCVCLVVQPIGVFAFETDQYNLPPEPLADIGSEVTEYALEGVQKAFEKLNKEITTREDCLKDKLGTENCDSAEKNTERLKYLRSEKGIAKAVFQQLGSGVVPFTKAGSWMESHKFTAQPARYKTGYKKSIYLTAPFNYLTISATVNLYGTQLGTDKIAHIFQQGFDYYAIYERALAKGLSEEKAVKKAVDWGRKTEKTYFGTWVGGIYSNADLASNYAGLKFYQGLTHEVKIGKTIRPATLILKDGKWQFNKNTDMQEFLLKPLISKHLNEAYNPSKILNILGLRNYVRRVVRKQACRQWFERDPNLNKAELEATTRSLEKWHSEDYGFSYSKNFVTIANTCFENNEPIKDEQN